MTKLFHVLIVSVFLGVVSTAGAQPPVSGQTPASLPSLKDGAERYRLVNKPDEIVSVLKNGVTVIAKRVPSPVVAVRGYVGTGGVYEGKWLGGGLSHLLEHLVAGGSSQRRTECRTGRCSRRSGIIPTRIPAKTTRLTLSIRRRRIWSKRWIY